MKSVVAIVFGACVSMSGAILYSTDGTASPGFSTVAGYTAQRAGAVTNAFAMQFTPAVTGTLDSITVAVISLTTGITTDNFLLTTDSSGKPGSTIETIAVALSASNALQTGTSALHPLLTAGTLYWLEIAAPATNGNVRWDLTSPVVSGKGWNSLSDATTTESLAAFELSGTTTPEPGTIAVVGAVLAAWITRRAFCRAAA